MSVLIKNQSGQFTQKVTLATAVAALDAVGKTIVVNSAITINDVTVPSTIALEVTKGGVITVNGGKTLTINGPLILTGGSFAGAGTVTTGTGVGLFDLWSGYLGTKSWDTLTLSSYLNEAKGADIASATTTDIGAATGNYVKVTGTTTITNLGTVQAGTRRIVEFTGILTLTHNGINLILPTGANITTAAGDVAQFVSLGSGNWKCVGYNRTSGSCVGTALTAKNSDGTGTVLKAIDGMRVARGSLTVSAGLAAWTKVSGEFVKTTASGTSLVLTFDTPFTGTAPIVSFGLTNLNISVLSVSTTAITATVGQANGGLVSQIDFIAIGPN